MPRDTVGYGASPNEACTLMRSRVAQAVLGNHDAAWRDVWTILLLLRRTPGAGQARSASRCEEHGVAEESALRLSGGWHPFLPRSPINIQAFDYIFARDQAAQCLAMWTSFPAHRHRPFHLCKSFAINPDHPGAQEVVTLKFELRAGWKYIISVGSVASRGFRSARQLHHLRHGHADFRVQARGIRHQGRRSQDPGLGSRTQLRHAPVLGI